MMTRDFGMGFFGIMPFGMDERKDFFEKWSKMTNEEKVESMNKRMESMNNGEHGTFCGKREFTVEAIDKRCEEWLKKMLEEKAALVKEREEMMNKFHEHVHSFAHGRGFGFGGGDRRECINDLHEKWFAMTPEEKKDFISKREEAMSSCGSFFGHFFSKTKE